MKKEPVNYLAALAILAIGVSSASAITASVSHTATTALTDQGGNSTDKTFGISVKAGNAKYVQSIQAGSASGPLGDGTLLDWQIHTAVNGESPFAGNTVSAGPGTYFDTAKSADSSVGGPQNYMDVWETSDIDTEAADIPSGTTPAVGNGPTPINGNIDISGLEDGQIYVINGTYRASVRVNLTMTGPGKTPIVMPEYVAPYDTSKNRSYLMEFTFSNPNGEYTNIEWSSNNGQNNTGRRRWGGVFLDGTLYVDTIPPTWIATYPNIDPLGSTLLGINGQTDEATTIYYVVLADGASAPTSAQVKAGTDGSDAAAPFSGDFAVAGLEEGSDLVTGLTASTAYDVYVVAEDVRGPNLQAAPVMFNVTTNAPDSTPPSWTATYPQQSRTPAAVTGIANIDEIGNAYFVVLASGAAAPTSAQVKAGTDASDVAAPSGSMSLPTAGVDGSDAVGGLTVGTTYDVYFVAEDLEGNLQAAPVLVTSAPAAATDQFVTGAFAWGTDSVWSTLTGGPYTDPWGDGNNAVFEGGAGTVTIDSGTTVNNITFNSSNWATISGGPLTLAGATTPTITVNGNYAKFETSISGTQGLIKEGNGTMRFNNGAITNTITGGWTLNGGSLGENKYQIGPSELNDNDITTGGAGTVSIVFRSNATYNTAITNNAPNLRITNNNSQVTLTGAFTGTGDIELNKAGDGRNELRLTSTANTFTGGVNYTGNRDIDLKVNSFVDSGTPGAGNIRFGNGNPTSNKRNTFELDSGAIAPVTLNNRQFEVASTNTGWRAEINNDSDQAFTINTDLIVTNATVKDLRLGGTGAGASTFAGNIGDGDGTLGLTKEDSGSWTLSGANTYTGATTVSAGTLALVGGSQASPITVNSGATLGLSIASPTTSTAAVTLDAGHKIAVTGTPDGTSDYVLMSASAITGAPTLDPVVPGYSLEVQGGGTQLVLAALPPTGTLVIDLGAGTVIEGGQFIGSGPTNLPLPSLPAGSILRSVAYDNVTLTATDNGNFTADLTVLLDPTPGTPGGDFSLGITSSGANQTFGGLGQTLTWSGGNTGVGTSLTETKTSGDWAATGDIDLATTGLFLGNAYQDTGWVSPQGGTWTGTITLTYDLVSAGTPFDSWAALGSMGAVTFDGDTNGDSVADGLAFLLGAANPDDNALGLLPTSSEDGSGGLVMTFTMLDAASRGTAALSVEHSGDLGITDAWAAALVPDTSSTVSGVDFVVSGSGTLNVVATIPSAGNAIGGQLFGRLVGTE